MFLRCFAAAGAVAALLVVFSTANAAVVISAKPTKNISCTGGVCTPTAPSAVLNVNQLRILAATFPSVVVIADAQAEDIQIAVPLNWSYSKPFVLDAYRSLIIKNVVSLITHGSLVLRTNDGGTGGSLSFSEKGKIVFWDVKSSLSINSEQYTLVNSVGMLADEIAMNSSGLFALSNDYDASGDGVYTSVPVPDFSGKFEGLGNRISNLTITDTASGETGLFGTIGFNSEISDVSLMNARVTGTNAQWDSHDVGTLLGINYHGTVRNVHVAGSVKAGGTYAYAGGLVGHNEGGSLLNCFARVKVEITGASGGYAAGLAGFQNSGSTLNCGAAGPVDGGTSGNGVGGLIGWNLGSLAQSYAMGSVSEGANGASLGGLVASNQGSIDNSYATGNVTGDSQAYVGGLVGDNAQIISDSYARGAVQGGPEATIGGLIGYDYVNNSKISDSYWDMDTSGVTDPGHGAGNIQNDPGIAGLTDSQLKSRLPEGFDPEIWSLNAPINNGYPYLIANPPPK